MSENPNRIFAVKQQMKSSYEDTTSDFETVSLHRTEKGANDYAAVAKKNSLISAITYGELDDGEAGPDDILGAIEAIDDELANEFRSELAKPGADYIEVVKQLIDSHGLSVADVRVVPQILKD